MNWRQLILSLMAIATLGMAVRAEDDPRTSTLSPDTTIKPRSLGPVFAPEKGGSAKDSSQVVGYFLALLALVGVGAYFLKRGLPMRGMKLGENRLHLLETKMLGNRQFLVVVRYDDNKMLIGVGPNQIQYLCSLDNPDDDLDKLMRQTNANQGGPGTV